MEEKNIIELPKDSELELEYRKLGVWRGENSTTEARNHKRHFWQSLGEPGVKWLIKRINNETNVDALAGVSIILAVLGKDAIEPILNALQRELTLDAELTLLTALGSMDTLPQCYHQKIVKVIKPYFNNMNLDLFEKTIRATRAIGQESSELFIAYAENTQNIIKEYVNQVEYWKNRANFFQAKEEEENKYLK